MVKKDFRIILEETRLNFNIIEESNKIIETKNNYLLGINIIIIGYIISLIPTLKIQPSESFIVLLILLILNIIFAINNFFSKEFYLNPEGKHLRDDENYINTDFNSLLLDMYEERIENNLKIINKKSCNFKIILISTIISIVLLIYVVISQLW